MRDKLGRFVKGKKSKKYEEKRLKALRKKLLGKKRKPFSESWKRKISEGHRGKIVSEETKKRMSKAHLKNPIKYWLGKKLSEETKRKMSKAHKGTKKPWVSKRLKLIRGPKNHFWKGGISPLIVRIRRCFKYRQWRSDVFTRDNYTCQKCDRRSGGLEAHHIKSFAQIIEEYQIKTFEQAMNCEELWNINNGITLCKKCHDKTKKGNKTIFSPSIPNPPSSHKSRREFL